MKVCPSIVLLAILGLGAPTAFAQGAGRPADWDGSGPWDGGVIAGAVVDVSGYALLLAGGPVTSFSLELGLGMIGTGALCMGLGGWVWTGALDSRERAYREEGIQIDAKQRSKSKSLLLWSTACEAGAIVAGLAADGSAAALYASLGLMGAACIIETCNALGPRLKWSASQIQGLKGRGASLDGPVLVPVVAPFFPAGDGGAGLYLGMRIGG